MVWKQKIISVGPYPRGCHLIHDLLQKEINNDIRNINIGLVNIFVKHTSASIALQENWDESVREDVEMALNNWLAPENKPYKHSCEGPDDMPAHLKAMLFGVSHTVPITNGKMNTGTWQGLWFCEHRDAGGARSRSSCSVVGTSVPDLVAHVLLAGDLAAKLRLRHAVLRIELSPLPLSSSLLTVHELDSTNAHTDGNEGVDVLLHGCFV
eukprot:Clim_evm91s156 gene=Clim_evmTU91s156